VVLDQDIARCRASIVEDEARIARQQFVIARLHRIGDDTSLSDRLLSNYIAVLGGHELQLAAYGLTQNGDMTLLPCSE
jgi:hypothetical protein